MSMFEAFILALIQGLTEFLPVSSSAHLLLPSKILGWPDQGLAFDVAVHVGSLFAVVLYFRNEVVTLLTAFFASIFKMTARLMRYWLGSWCLRPFLPVFLAC